MRKQRTAGQKATLSGKDAEGAGVKKKKFNKSALPLYLMILPAVIITFIYKYIPMAGSIIAFEDYKLTKGVFDSTWVWFDNFKYIFNLPDFWNVLRNTFLIAFAKMIGNLIVPIAVALLLNELRQVGLKRSIQTLLYIPNFLSWIILAGMFTDILSPSSGIVNQLLGYIGVGPIDFLGSNDWFPFTMVATDIWKNFGYGTIVYLASLASIDPALYESARMDGASRWQQTIHITLPGMSSIIVLMSLLSMGSILNAGFDQIYNLLNPMVHESGEIIDTLVYNLSLGNGMYGPATALGLMNSLVSFTLISLGYILADKFLDYRIF